MSKKVKKRLILAGAGIFCLLLILLQLLGERGRGQLYEALELHPRRECSPWSVTVLDVGQGQGVLIRTAGHAVLVDCGEAEAAPRVLSALDRYSIRRLDAAVVTHLHSDHMGAMGEVLREVSANTFWIPQQAEPQDDLSRQLFTDLQNLGIPVEHPSPGDQLYLGEGVALKVLGPVRAYSEANNQSMVLLVTTPQGNILLCGDMQKQAEADLLAAKADVKADVLVVGHHGSATSTSEEFLKAVSPKIAVLSVGWSNFYGLPDNTVIGRLEESGIRVVSTDLDGEITIAPRDGHLEVLTQK